jgi:hypothetical protein
MECSEGAQEHGEGKQQRERAQRELQVVANAWHQFTREKTITRPKLNSARNIKIFGELLLAYVAYYSITLELK